VHFAYIDESGDSGPKGSSTFALACVLIESSAWPAVFDDVIEYRRFLRVQFGVPVRGEIKANHLLQNRGVFRKLKLSEGARFAVYRGCLRLQPKLGTSVFAVVINKTVMAEKGRTEDPRGVAWEYLVQRLERFTTYGSTEVMIVHDEGYAAEVRGLARKWRRIGTAGSMFGTGSLTRPAKLILDDPVARKSHESYFLQFADLAAYAAFRRLNPPPPRLVPIVPQGMWDELGDARFAAVNRYSGGPPGIVSWP
jgi:hypothetical protein